MATLIGGDGDGAPDADLVKDVTLETFQEDVLEASLDTPVIVDFWAAWCGPCKQLTPVLEKVVRAARGAVRLAKIDIDRNQAIAQQMRIQSVPTVIAFLGGQPVDAFQGALPESQVKAFVDKLAEAAGTAADDPLAEAVAAAREALEREEHDVASSMFTQIVGHAPDNVDALAGLARAQAALGETARAEEALGRIPEDQADHPDAAAARAAVALARRSESVGDLGALEAAAAADPRNLQALHDLGVALFAAGRREEAVDRLVDILKIDRTWNEGAARAQLIEFFDVMGPCEETAAGRRKMSSVLFS